MLLVGASAAGWLFFSAEWKKVATYGATGAVALLFCLFSMWFLILRQGGNELLRMVYVWQFEKRMEPDDLFCYALDGMINFAPCTILALAALILERKHILKSPVFRLTGFWLLPLILLSIPGCKHTRYMLLTLSAFSLAGAFALRQTTNSRIWNCGVRHVLRILDFVIYPGAVIVGGIMTGFYLYWRRQNGEWSVWSPVLGFLSLAASWILLRRKCSPLHRLLRVGTASAIVLILFANPVMDARECSWMFVTQTELLRTGKLFFYRIDPDHEDLKYILFVAPERREKNTYLYSGSNGYSQMYNLVKDPDLKHLVDQNDVLILRDKHLTDLNRDAAAFGLTVEILGTGKLGHKMHVACRLRSVPSRNDVVTSEPRG